MEKRSRYAEVTVNCSLIKLPMKAIFIEMNILQSKSIRSLFFLCATKNEEANENKQICIFLVKGKWLNLQ